MSKRISIQRAKQLYNKELELREMQRQGIPLPNSRRRKKYEMTRKHQDGFLWRLKDRIKRTGGTLPEHLKDKIN